MQVRNGAYALDCDGAGFDKMLDYMRTGRLSSHLSADDLVGTNTGLWCCLDVIAYNLQRQRMGAT